MGGRGLCDEHLFISLEKGKIYHVLSRYASIVCMCTVKLAITVLKSTRYFKWTEIFRGVTRASGAPLLTIAKNIKTFHSMHLNLFSFICKHNTIGKNKEGGISSGEPPPHFLLSNKKYFNRTTTCNLLIKIFRNVIIFAISLCLID